MSFPDVYQVMPGDDLWLPQTASMIKFRELRSMLAGKLKIDESTIRPETRLAAIVPPHRRHEILGLINGRDRGQGPSIKANKLPLWFAEIIASTALSLLFLFQPWFLVLLTLPISIVFANTWRGSYSTRWPSGLETMHELAISQTHYNKTDAAKGLWPRAEISAKVRWIIANQLGAPFDEITEETDLLDLCL